MAFSASFLSFFYLSFFSGYSEMDGVTFFGKNWTKCAPNKEFSIFSFHLNSLFPCIFSFHLINLYYALKKKNFFRTKNYTNCGRNYTAKNRRENYTGIIKCYTGIIQIQKINGQFWPIYELYNLYQNYKSAQTKKIKSLAIIHLLYW